MIESIPCWKHHIHSTIKPGPGAVVQPSINATVMRMPQRPYLLIGALALTQCMYSQPLQQLLDSASTLPPMPRETADLLPFVGALPTFSSGTPYNDIEFSVFDTDYMEGETSGYDQFMPVDPSDPLPGTGKVKLVNAQSNVDADVNYNAGRGDRIVLGTHELPRFFQRGPDGLDNDYAVIINFDYINGHIQLKGLPTDYTLVYCNQADGCATEGWYLYHTSGGDIDLIAFIHPCWDLAGTVGGVPPTNPLGWCNTDSALSLTNAAQFRFAQPIDQAIALQGGIAQVGTSGKEVVGGLHVDASGNSYLIGLTDGDLDGAGDAPNESFVIKVSPNGQVLWTTEVATAEGTLFMDAIDDGTSLYVCGRTLGALPGFTNAGRWDGILLKLRMSDGVILGTDQWGNQGMDGYGNIVLDDSGHLFVSGAGSPPGTGGTDDLYLVAKHATSDLGNVWRALTVPAGNVIGSSEAWGGLSYAPVGTPGDGRLVAAGWYMAPNGSQGFIDVYEDLNAAAPVVAHQVAAASLGFRADWVLDNAIDSQGNIYAVGFTTGNLGGPPLGEGDAFIVKYAPDLSSPQFVKVGTARADQFRKLVIDANDRLYAIGYTYGNLAGTNADASQRSGDVFVHKYDTDLALLGGVQFGTPHEDRGTLALNGPHLHAGGMTEASLTGANQGSYDAFVLALDTADLSIMQITTAVEVVVPAEGTFRIFPTPTDDLFTIAGHLDPGTMLRILDMNGREVLRLPVSGSGSYSAQVLAPGAYVIEALEEGRPLRSRLIKW
jgi:hypothetical protein